MIAFENIEHLRVHSPAIGRFRNTPLARDALLASVEELQWPVVLDTTEYLDGEDGICRKVCVPGTEELCVWLLVDDTEKQVAVPLVWLIDESHGPDPDAVDGKERGLIVASLSEYHRGYDQALQVLIDAWGIPNQQGQATSDYPTAFRPASSSSPPTADSASIRTQYRH